MHLNCLLLSYYRNLNNLVGRPTFIQTMFAHHTIHIELAADSHCNSCFQSIDLLFLMLLFMCLAAFRPDIAYNVTTIRDFDDAITRVAFGWPSVDAYYAGSSSSDVVNRIAIPYLAVQVCRHSGAQCVVVVCADI